MKPSFTQIPNEIIEAMPDMGEAELKLTAVLVRLTYGYHRDEVKLRYVDMETAAHLSRGGVCNAIEAIEKRGFFKRGNKSMWYTNSIPDRLNTTEETEEIVYPVDKNSLPSRQKSIDKSLPSRPSSYNRNKEEPKENIYIPPDTDEIAELKTAVSCVAREPLWEKTAERYDQFAHILFDWGQTPEDVKGFAKWWAINKPLDYSGKPALTSVINRYQDYMAGVVVHTNGNGTHEVKDPMFKDYIPGQSNGW